jgi:4-hydroxysphinganine ceramide fatty acyl 2-hydroxylase
MANQKPPTKLKVFTAEEVELHNKEESAYIIIQNKKKQRNEVFNVTRFLNLHPGGKSIMLQHAGKDVTEEFYSNMFHAHSEKAERMLQNYLVGVIADEKNDLNSEIEGVSVHSMQNLIDWKLPLLSQIMALPDPKTYQVWLHNVHNPYKRIKLFTTEFLEDYFTHWPWWYVFVWIPVTMYAFGLSLKYNNMNVMMSLGLFLMGMFSWTFAEYLIHRYMFHVHTESHAGNFYHFFAHGIHHLTPLDEQRLTFPPTFSLVLGSLLFYLFNNILTPIWSSSMAFV